MEYIGGGELFEKVVADDFALTERDCMLFMRQVGQIMRSEHYGASWQEAVTNKTTLLFFFS